MRLSSLDVYSSYRFNIVRVVFNADGKQEPRFGIAALIEWLRRRVLGDRRVGVDSRVGPNHTIVYLLSRSLNLLRHRPTSNISDFT